MSRVLQMIDCRKEARVILESGAAKLAETVVNTDDPAVALKALGKLDVIRDDRIGDDGGDRVTIVIGQPGAPIALPDIVVQALPASASLTDGSDAA